MSQFCRGRHAAMRPCESLCCLSQVFIGQVNPITMIRLVWIEEDPAPSFLIGGTVVLFALKVGGPDC